MIVAALERFKLYLIGKPFVVVTDCQTITATKSNKELNARVERWGLRQPPWFIERTADWRMLMR